MNDDFESRISLAGYFISLTAIGTNATKQPGEPNHAGITGGKSLWWSWVAPATGIVRISTAGSSFDSGLGLYTGGDLGNLTEVASNDDADNTVSTSLIRSPVAAGTEYQIAVDGYGGATSLIVLEIRMEKPGLEVSYAAGQLVLSWSADYRGFVLESCKALGPGAVWDQVPSQPGVTGSHFVLTTTPSKSVLFYRLRYP